MGATQKLVGPRCLPRRSEHCGIAFAATQPSQNRFAIFVDRFAQIAESVRRLRNRRRRIQIGPRGPPQARAAEAESERFPVNDSENAAADSLLNQFQAPGRTSTEFAISVDEQRAHAPSDWLVAASIRRRHAKHTPSPSDTIAESDELASANAAADDGTKDVVAANAHRPRADQHVTHA